MEEKLFPEDEQARRQFRTWMWLFWAVGGVCILFFLGLLVMLFFPP